MLDFELVPQKIPTATWIALGQCAARQRQIATTPLAPSFRQKLKIDALTKGVYASAALENGTITEFE
ncbi:hypothetical protein MNBD_NITROSPINAE01-551, partial [hydrothermal vent metagenome]